MTFRRTRQVSRGKRLRRVTSKATSVLNAWPGRRDMPRPTVEDIAKDILEYFLRNPQAADDLEGVARWRLMSQTVHRDVEETSQALDYLVQKGLLTRVSRPGSAFFRLQGEQRDDAKAFLASDEQKTAADPKQGLEQD